MAEVKLNIKTTYDDRGTKQLQGALGKLSGIATGPIGLGIVGLGAGVAAGFGAATVAVVEFSDDVTGAMQSFSAETGVANDELGEYKDIALDIFASNWGESVTDVAEAMAEVRNTTGAANEELQKMTQNALIFRDRFGKDINETTDAATVLMEEFGLTSDQAFDFMAEGIKRGLDRSGDFLDTIREYGNLFSDNGFEAQQFFSILETGTQGGVLGTDKIADSFKEAGITIRELSDDVLESLEIIGVDVDTIFNGLQDGSVTVADALNEILPAILSLENPIHRNTLGVKVFGTMWEDLGASAFESLDLTKTQLDDLTGSMEQASQSGATIGEAWESGMRRLQVATEPIGAEIAPMLVEALGGVAGFIEQAQPIFSQFADTFAVTLQGAAVIVADALERIGPAIGLTGENASASEVALAALEKTLGLINTTVQVTAVGIKIFADWVEWNSEIRSQLGDILNLVDELFGKLGSADFSLFGDSGGFLGIGQGEGGLFGRGGVLGFQHGGSFTVGGAGGPDSQLVMFRASPGETVSVNTPSQNNIPGIDTGRVSGAVMQAAQKIAGQMLKQFENDLVRELSR